MISFLSLSNMIFFDDCVTTDVCIGPNADGTCANDLLSNIFHIGVDVDVVDEEEDAVDFLLFILISYFSLSIQSCMLMYVKKLKGCNVDLTITIFCC